MGETEAGKHFSARFGGGKEGLGCPQPCAVDQALMYLSMLHHIPSSLEFKSRTIANGSQSLQSVKEHGIRSSFRRALEGQAYDSRVRNRSSRYQSACIGSYRVDHMHLSP